MTALARSLVAVVFAIAALTPMVAPAAASSGPRADRAPGAPAHLTVDDARAPLGLDDPVPTFAWQVVDADADQVQSAYEVLVSRSPTRDPADPRVVWDSGRVVSDAQSYVPYGGPALVPDTTWFWTVRTWDRAGVTGRFAPPQRFDSGLRDPDWVAQWIRRGSFMPSTTTPEDYSYARKEVVLAPAPIERAVAYVSASHQYELHVNGQVVDRGPAFSYPDAQYSRAVDVSSSLRPGRPNALGLLTHWYGAGQGRPAAAPGVILQLAVQHADGARELIVTDATWRMHAAEWLPAPMRNEEGDFVEHIDGRSHPGGWDRPGYDDGSWEPATALGRHPTAPWTHLVAQRTRVVEHRVLPISVRRVGGGFVADFGRVFAATPSVELRRGVDGRTVRLTPGYLLERDGRVSRRRGTQGTDLRSTYVERAGAQTFRPYWYLGFRYLEVDGAGERLGRDAITALARHQAMPDEHAATFHSSDHRLERVWELARHSALYGSQEQFVDTPTREKGQFLADAFNVSATDMRAFGDRLLTQQALGEFARSQVRDWPDGRVNAAEPTGNGPNDIPDYTELFPAWVWRYYIETGDRGRLAQLYAVVANIADYVARSIDPATGLVTSLPGGGTDYHFGIVDYPITMRYGYDMRTTARTTVNVLAVEVFRRVADAGEAIGRPDAEVGAQRERARALTRAINAGLTRGDGLYVDGLDTRGARSSHVSQHANAYALAARIVPRQRVGRVASYVARRGVEMGPMTIARLLEALRVTGRLPDLVRLLTDAHEPGYAQILARGATFTWESWMPLDALGESMSHAWGANVLAAMQEALLGVRPLAPGFARFEVRPPASGLRDAAGRVPTPRGAVAVAWHRDGSTIRLRISVPANAVAVVALPGRRAVTLGSGRHLLSGRGRGSR